MATDSSSNPAARAGRRRRADPRGPPALRVPAARAAQRAERPRRPAPADRRALVAHGEAEESKVYPQLERKDAIDEEEAEHGKKEHDEGYETLLPLLEATELYDEDFSEHLHEFSETLLHHLDEEERDILNPAREDVSRGGPRPARRGLARRAQPDARRGLRQRGAGARARRRLLRSLEIVLADTRPLRNPHFRRLWTANIVTVVGAQLTVVAVPAQIYAMTGSSAYVGLTGVFGLVPLVVFGLWGGALADVIDRRTLLVCTTLGLIATSTLFWLQAWSGADQRVAAARPVLGAAGVLRGQPADPERRTPPAAAAEPAAGGQLAEHDGDAGRRHRRSADRGSADPGVRASRGST